MSEEARKSKKKTYRFPLYFNFSSRTPTTSTSFNRPTNRTTFTHIESRINERIVECAPNFEQLSKDWRCLLNFLNSISNFPENFVRRIWKLIEQTLESFRKMEFLLSSSSNYKLWAFIRQLFKGIRSGTHNCLFSLITTTRASAISSVL